jgi:phage terminase large subunit-like protein
MQEWNACGAAVSLEHVAGRRAWGGLDLSAVSDFTAWWVGVESLEPGVDLDFFWRFYVPEERVDDLNRHLQVPLKKWIEDGAVKATEGNVIDYAAIEKDVIADCRLVDMQRVGYDRMFAGQMVQNLAAELVAVEVVPIAQTYLGHSPAIKELTRLLGLGAVRHGGNMVARWMASVVEAKGDGQDNYRLVKPERQQSQARIDGISALVNGLDGYLRRPIETHNDIFTASSTRLARG